MKIITVEELISELKKYNHKELHVHHTWKPDHTDWNKKPDGLYWQQSMKNYHVNTNGWSDIGQHVTLLPDGLFVTGRDFSKNPASISGYNSGAFAVEMLGNFDVGRDKFEGPQKNSMIKLAKFFYDRGKYIRFHRENETKTCPGTSINKEEFMKEVKSFGKNKSFKDIHMASNWAKPYIEKSFEYGLLVGDNNGNFNPKNTCTREELAAVIVRLYEKVKGG